MPVFKIYNHDLYNVKDIAPYDCYGMVTASPWWNPPSDSIGQKLRILDVFREDICCNVAQYIEIQLPYLINNAGQTFQFSVYVYDAEISAMMKLIYG